MPAENSVTESEHCRVQLEELRITLTPAWSSWYMFQLYSEYCIIYSSIIFKMATLEAEANH